MESCGSTSRESGAQPQPAGPAGPAAAAALTAGAARGYAAAVRSSISKKCRKIIHMHIRINQNILYIVKKFLKTGFTLSSFKKLKE